MKTKFSPRSRPIAPKRLQPLPIDLRLVYVVVPFGIRLSRFKLPPDAYIVRTKLDMIERCSVHILHSNSFETLNKGDKIPLLQPPEIDEESTKHGYLHNFDLRRNRDPGRRDGDMDVNDCGEN